MNFRLLGIFLLLGAALGAVYFLNLKQQIKFERAAADSAHYYEASGEYGALRDMPAMRPKEELEPDEDLSKSGLLICLVVGFIGLGLFAAAKRSADASEPNTV